MGDRSVNAYFHKIKSIVTRLNDLESPMNDDDVVTYAMHGLSDKFAHVAGIIAHRVLFPDLETMHSMVITEEMRLNTKSQNSNSNTTSSAPTILIVETNSNHGQDSRSSRDNRTSSRQFEPQICRNFSRAFCKWGNTCKFIHDANRAISNSTAHGSVNNARIEPSHVNSTGPLFSTRTENASLSQAFNTMTLQDPVNNNWNMDTGGLDFWTRQILLKCDSMSDMYPVTKSTPPQAFLVNQHTWHQRLGHPGSNVLRYLVFSNFISYNKTKSPVLCHACQLGKLLLSLLLTLHSDLWTSPLSSITDGSLNRYKAHLAANGSTQLPGNDVDETFSPVAKPATICTVLSLALSRHLHVH
ncbi:ribonuclease H-like domain-containing protein [Tanacetum coccineum]